MYLEQQLQKLTDAVTQLILVIESQKLPVAQLSIVEQVPNVPAPTPIAPVMVTPPVQAIATPAPVLASPSSVMPPPPVFAAPAPVVPVVNVPFTDGKGLIDYVMKSYSEMGTEKGAGIGNVLNQLGYKNINDVKPEHYAALFAGIEGLK